MNSTAPANVDLSHQLAIITGGGRDLGRAFAKGLSAAKATTVVIARSEEELEETVTEIRAAGGQASAYLADVTNRSAVQKIIEDIKAKYGTINLLVNNAGVGGSLGPLSETDPDAWWHNLKVNPQGPMLFSRYALPGMILNQQGRIINICSGAGLVGIPNLSPYVVSKTALIRFTEILALEGQEYGISAFALGPGTVRTTMTDFGLSAEGQKWIPWFGRIFEEGRDVPPDLSVNLVVQLAAGRYDALSGRYLSVHQNLDLLLKQVDDIPGEDLYTLRLKT